MEKPQYSAPSTLFENGEEIPQAPKNNGSNINQLGLANVDSQEPQSRRSQRGSIPRRRFEIEREAFMIAPCDIAKPKAVKEALASLTNNEWKVAMLDEMESMRKNHVWDLVDLPPGH